MIAKFILPVLVCLGELDSNVSHLNSMEDTLKVDVGYRNKPFPLVAEKGIVGISTIL